MQCGSLMTTSTAPYLACLLFRSADVCVWEAEEAGARRVAPLVGACTSFVASRSFEMGVDEDGEVATARVGEFEVEGEGAERSIACACACA